jgi:hypothetical protein
VSAYSYFSNATATIAVEFIVAIAFSKVTIIADLN